MGKEKIKPLGDNILIAPAIAKVRSNIYMPDDSKQSIRGIVLCVGPDVKYIRDMDIVLVEANARKTKWDKEILVKESEVMLKMEKGKYWIPLGNNAFVIRDNGEQRFGSIVIPAAYQSSDQTLDAFFVRMGLNAKSDLELEPGDKIKIDMWHPDIRQVRIDDKSYMIVPTKYIELKYVS